MQWCKVLTVFVVPLMGLILFPLVLPPLEGLAPIAYHPLPAVEMVGPLAPNNKLKEMQRLSEGVVEGPEALAVDANGRIYASTADGKILLDDGSVFVETGGRPLGIAFDSNKDLIVCDSHRGLLKVDAKTKTMKVMTDKVDDGTPVYQPNDLDISKEGIIYFSDCTAVPVRFENGRWNTLEASVTQVMAANPTGRLLAYNPKTNQTTVVMSGLSYANGVALSEKEDFVLVAETGKYRVHRCWIKGDKAGLCEIFLDRLPGTPDNINRGKGGIFRIPLYTVRNKILDAAHPYPWVKHIMGHLPRFIRPKPQKYGFIVIVNEKGEVIDSLQDPSGEIAPLTSTLEVDGKLYIGSLTLPYFGLMNLETK